VPGVRPVNENPAKKVGLNIEPVSVQIISVIVPHPGEFVPLYNAKPICVPDVFTDILPEGGTTMEYHTSWDVPATYDGQLGLGIAGEQLVLLAK
jgi:hypothetical protein